MFETPKPPQLTIAVSANSMPFEQNQLGKLQLLSPEETVMAFILAVRRDLDDVAKAEAAQFSSMFVAASEKRASWRM